MLSFSAAGLLFCFTQLTYKSRDADVLSVVDPHDGRNDFINEALRHSQLQQRIGERPSGHVDEASATKRVQEFFHRAEGVAVGLVLIDPVMSHTLQSITEFADIFKDSSWHFSRSLHLDTKERKNGCPGNHACRSKQTGKKKRLLLLPQK